MEKEVLIHIRGLQITEDTGDDVPIEIIVPGEYYFRNGSHYLRYEEQMEGFSQPIANFVKFSPRGMEVRKKGTVSTNMVFQKGKRTMSVYTTPFGNIEMGISATELEIIETQRSIAMKVKYILDTGEQQLADCTLDIQAYQKKDGEFRL